MNLARKSMFDENKSNSEEDFDSLAAEHVPHLVIDNAIIFIITMIITMINIAMIVIITTIIVIIMITISVIIIVVVVIMINLPLVQTARVVCVQRYRETTPGNHRYEYHA